MTRSTNSKGSVAKTRRKKRAAHSHPKAEFSFRHSVLPPLLGVGVMLGVAGAMNGEWLAAQAQYHFVKPVAVQTAVVSSTQLDPNAPPELSIPVIKVKAPVVFEPSAKEEDIQLALRRGVVKLTGSADPGQTGNVVIFGHSSGRPWAPGEYKFIFTLLNKLEQNQKITVDYKGTRYIYNVTGSKVVLPSDVSVLNKTSSNTLTLITCSPVGSNTHRLVVTAEQISPKPSASATVTIDTRIPNQPSVLPNGSQESLLQSLRDLF